MTFGSLFSGIGGADIAAVAVGWDHEFWCEIDPFCRKVLGYWFKNSEGYGDIKETDFRKWRGQIGVLHGSTPCQSVSVAGKRRGDSDDRWLWREMLRAIHEIQPAWVTFENVANIKNVVSSSAQSCVEDGICYEGKEGLLYSIIEDLEAEGYQVQTFIIPACAVGAPHLRKRIWIVGYSSESGSKRCRSWRCDREERSIHTEFERELAQDKSEWSKRKCGYCQDGEDGYSPDADSKFLEGGNANREDRRSIKEKSIELFSLSENWEMFPAQSPICGRDDGIPGGVAFGTFPKWRKEALKALGNALVPQVIYEIYKSINEIENGKEK